MKKVKYFETEDGKQLKTAEFDGYNINDRTFEGLMFQVDVNEDGTLKVYVKTEDEDFFSDFNEAKWLKIATEYSYNCDSYRDPKTLEDCWLTVDGQEATSTNTTATPIAVTTGRPVSMSSGIPNMKSSIQDIAEKLGLGKVTYTDEGITIVDKEETEVEVKEPVIGEFKPKRKFISFVSAVAGKKIRLIRETAFIKGESLSGTLEGAKFKVTICDEGTIDFSEVEGTNLSDTAMRQRLIDDIDAIDVTGYAQKFIVAGLEFEDQDGYRCFLEVDYVKPYDKLMALFAEEADKSEVEETPELSEKGLNFLDMLLSGDDAEVEPVAEPVKEETYLEKQFRLMNEGKVNELKDRIEKTEGDIKRYTNEAKHAEANATKACDDLEILETRLESLVPNATPNGYVFLVSDEQTNDITLDDNSKQLVDKISSLLKINKEKLVKHLTDGYYKISIAKKDNFEDKKVTREIYQLIQSVDLLGNFSATGDGEFEYRGKLNWHQLTAKMLKKGFEQEPEFDKVAGSNSYEVKTEREVVSNNGGFVLVAEKGMPFSNNATTVEREVTKKVENPEFKQKTLFSCDKPQTIILLGDGTNDCDSYDFQVTDDESGFDIYVGGKDSKKYSSCTGFGSVLTLKDYKKWLKDTEDEGYRDITDAFIIPGFVGTIGISAKLDDGSYSTDFDMDDYIQHQFDDSYADVIINLPEGTEFYQIKDHDLSSVTAVLRDDKIAAVLADTDEVEETTNLTVFIGNKGGWLKNSDTNKHIFDKLSFVGNMYEPKKGDAGEKICNTTTRSGKTYVRVRFPEGECVINQDKLR